MQEEIMLTRPLEYIHNLIKPRTNDYKITYLLFAVVITIFEFLLQSISTPHNSMVYFISILSGIVLAIAPWIGRLGDFFYILLFVFIDIFYCSKSCYLPLFGVFLIAVVWIICKHSFKAILLLISISILETTISENSVERIVSEVILITIVMGVGFSFRVLTDRENTYIKKLAILRQESASAEASIRKELAIHLHDTIAKDLARLSILSQNLAATHPDLADEVEPLITIPQDASNYLRHMIMRLNIQSTNPSLIRAIKESTAMLRSRDITLHSDVITNIDNQLPRNTIITTSLFIREVATNVLKYGQSGSKAELYIDLDESEVSLMMSNQIGDNLIQNKFTGGFGLVNLQSQIENEGGRMSFVSTGKQWIINATMPIAEVSKGN